MKIKVKFPLTFYVFLMYFSGSFSSFADSKVKLINNTNDPINVFFRGKDASTQHVKTLAPNSISSYTIEPLHIENKRIFEVISAAEGGNPNWKGSGCFNLEAHKNHTLFIEKTFQGLKTSCAELIRE